MAFLSCTFNNIDLGTLTNTSITRIDIHSRPTINMLGYKLSRQDGSKLVNAEYADKVINVTGYIAATDRTTYETNRDTLMGKLSGQEGTVSITQGGATRNYTATVQDIQWTMNEGGLGVFTIVFYCSNPFGQDATATTLLNAVAITAATSTQTFVAITGSFKASPIITLTISALTGGTNKYVRFTNPANGKAITITRSWANSDSLIIDCTAKTVQVNAVTVDYTGIFPDWSVADTQIQYDDTLTTRTVALTLSYTKRYL